MIGFSARKVTLFRRRPVPLWALGFAEWGHVWGNCVREHELGEGSAIKPTGGGLSPQQTRGLGRDIVVRRFRLVSLVAGGCWV
jgi:hypothetical protein